MPLVLLPVIIHLISQKKRKIIDYPSLKFIRAAYMKKSRRMRINEILLLIIRTLIVAFIIFAFARLLMFTPDAAPAGGKYVLIIDNSYSTAYPAPGTQPDKYLDIIKSKALETVSAVKNDPKFIIYTPASPLKDSGLLGAAEAAEYIKKINYTYRIFSITDMISSAEKNEAYRDMTGVYIFSDFISSDRGEDAKLAAHIETDALLKQGPRFELVDCGPKNLMETRNNKNLSIVQARASEDRIIAGKPFQVSCKIKNHSILQTSSEVSLICDGVKLASAEFGAAAGEICDVNIAHTFMNSGNYSLKLSLAEDAVAFDNVYNLVLAPLSSLYVLIICDHEQSLREDYIYKYVSSALNPLSSISLKDGLIIQPMVVNLNNDPPLDFKNFDAVIISGVKNPPAALAQKLEKYLNDGGGVLFLPPEAAYIKNFSAAFSRLLPLDLSLSSPVSSPDEKSAFNLASINYDHPIFAIFKNKNSGDIERPKFYKIIACESKGKPDSGVSVIAGFERSIPALAEKKTGRGTAVIFSGYLDRTSSNISDSPLFVPFMHQIVYHIDKNRGGGSRAHTIGETIRETYNVNDRISGISCMLPDSSVERRLDIKTGPEGLYSEISDTFSPGFYTLFKKSDDKITQKKYAVNFDARESELESRDYEAISSVLNRHSLLKTAQGQNSVNSEKKTEVTPYLFMAILILMALESLVTYFMKL